VNVLCDDDAQIIFGAVVDDTLGEEVRVTVIAAGFERSRRPGARGIASGVSTSRTPTPASAPLFDEDENDPFDIPDFVEG
ncbi:MAG TPA: cell division protein FtsZ, partial [Actinobacteria bacterium]|nr:cell division protein FtsZ [Actinomycetota bacterium]